jgi:hypothetical protein
VPYDSSTWIDFFVSIFEAYFTAISATSGPF